MAVTGYAPFVMSGGVVLAASDPATTGTGTITGDADTFSTDESDASFATLLRGLGQWPNDPFFTLRTESLRMDIGTGDGINSAFRVKARVSAGTATGPFILIGIGSDDLSTFFYVTVNIPDDGSYYDDSLEPAWITFADPSSYGSAAAFVATGTAKMFINAYANANHYDIEVAEASIGGPSDEIVLPCDTWVDLDLSAATQLGTTGGDPFGQYSDGVIWTNGGDPDFYFKFELDPVKALRIDVTFDPDSAHDGGTRFVRMYALRPGHEQDDLDAAYAVGLNAGGCAVLYNNGIFPVPTGDVQSFTIGPGRDRGPGIDDSLPGWSDATLGVTAGYTRLWFETANAGAVSAIRIRKVCKTVVPPLRLTNRSDMFSSAPRLAGGSSRQGSNRVTGYL